MHRVVSKCLDHHGRWLVEAGPWLATHAEAEHWAALLRGLGYIASIDTIHHPLGEGDQDFHNALASMA